MLTSLDYTKIESQQLTWIIFKVRIRSLCRHSSIERKRQVGIQVLGVFHHPSINSMKMYKNAPV